MTFWKAVRSTYGGAAAFLVACPLLALVPVVSELVQHLAEVQIGMYDSIAAAKAVEHHPLRMGLGLVKILALTVPTYWVSRYLFSRSPAFAARLESPSVGLFAYYLLFQMLLAAANLALPVESVAAFVALFGLGLLVSALVAAWGVASSLGNRAIGLEASVRLMTRNLPWTIALQLIAMLPLMVIHYAAAAVALLGPKPLLWPILVADSLLVGYLSALMVAASYFAAMRAADRAGAQLAAKVLAD